VSIILSAKADEILDMKVINYRDAVEFKIPSNWNVEDEIGIQGTFYENLPDTGTLRVSVYEWQSESEQDRNTKLQSALLPGNIETLAQGIYLKEEIKEVQEGSEKLSLYRWSVALALPDNLFRLIVFTHSIVKGQEEDPKIAIELELIDNSVRTAKFSYKTDLKLVDKV